MGKVHGNIICSDRLDIRSEGSVTGDVVVQRISVEDGAILKGSVQVQAASEQKNKSTAAVQATRTTKLPKPRPHGGSLVRKNKFWRMHEIVLNVCGHGNLGAPLVLVLRWPARSDRYFFSDFSVFRSRDAEFMQ